MEDLLGVSCYLPSGLIALVANAHPKSCHSNEQGFVTGHPTTVLVSTDISVYMSAFQLIRSVLTFWVVVYSYSLVPVYCVYDSPTTVRTVIAVNG